MLLKLKFVNKTKLQNKQGHYSNNEWWVNFTVLQLFDVRFLMYTLTKMSLL